MYSFAAMDDRGRLGDRVALRSLGWIPGTCLALDVRDGLVLVTADAEGSIAVTTHGHLRLPAPVRHWCGLEPGARVLLVADAVESRLVVYPPVALDAVIGRWQAEVFGGDCA